MATFPIYTGTQGNCHIQGIAVDPVKGYIYYSFTTKLIKSTLDGQIVGSVDGLTGHLGCMDFNDKDGKVYASLEYKNDAIGQGIRKSLGMDPDAEMPSSAFYMCIFDVDKIDRMDMDARTDGVMKAVYLKEVVDDYEGTGFNNDHEICPHHLGCSGIDGTAFGPMPGSPDREKEYLFVCYGIYSDLARSDNDHQVVLCYDTSDWNQYAKVLSEKDMHQSGPASPLHKFFVYTGNTTYGVQNIEYDRATETYFLALYEGRKPCFPNYSLMGIDALVAPEMKTLTGLMKDDGVTPAEGECLTLKKFGQTFVNPVATDNDSTSGITSANGMTSASESTPAYLYGCYQNQLGTTGLYAYGDGRYLISEHQKKPEGQCSYIWPYSFDPERGFYR